MKYALYDVFVDWPGRLGREVPGLLHHLNAAGARRVLDVGCGTGRHVQALRGAGLDAHGADASEDMLHEAEGLLGSSDGLHAWRLGDDVPASLDEAGPFDAAIAMGNVWPQLVEEEQGRRAIDGLRRLVRPGGILLMGLKAVAARRGGSPYLPLLSRTHEGRPLWFVRFCEFDVPPGPDGVERCGFHFVVVGGDGDGADDPLHHTSSTWRVWDAGELRRWLTDRGLEQVRVGGQLADPDVPPTGEDVFVHAAFPSA